jgi:hypothetical protein
MKKILLGLTASVIILAACKKDSTTPAAAETGNLNGTIKLYDDKTNALADASGVTISVIGNPEKTVVTGAGGSFSLTGLPFDNYDLAFSKTGYGTYKIFGIEHRRQPGTPAGSISQTQISRVINLGAVSTTAVSALTALDNTYNDQPGIEYSYTLSPAPSASNRGYVRALLSKNKPLSAVNFLSYSEVKSVISNNAKGGFTAEDLYGLGFNKGDSIYVRVYGESFYSNDYTEPNTGKRIFPNLNAVSAEPVGYEVP